MDVVMLSLVITIASFCMSWRLNEVTLRLCRRAHLTYETVTRAALSRFVWLYGIVRDHSLDRLRLEGML